MRYRSFLRQARLQNVVAGRSVKLIHIAIIAMQNLDIVLVKWLPIAHTLTTTVVKFRNPCDSLSLLDSSKLVDIQLTKLGINLTLLFEW